MKETTDGGEFSMELMSIDDSRHGIKKQVRFAEDVGHEDAKKNILPDNDDENQPEGIKLVLTVIALSLSTFICALDLTITSTATPKMSDEFDSLDQIGWYGSIYFLTKAAFQHAWAQLYRRSQSNGIFVASLAIFELGSLLCGVAQNSTVLLIGRGLTGIGRAGILSGVFTILAQIAPASCRTKYSRVLGGVYGLAAATGPVLGGINSDHLSWRWCFFLDLPIGVLAAVIVLVFLRTVNGPISETASRNQRLLELDPFGMLAMLLAMVCYLYAMRGGGVTHSWRSEGVTFLILGFAVGLFFIFTAIEWRMKDRAMLCLDLILHGHTLAYLLHIFFLAGAYFSLLYYLPVRSQSIGATSATDSGLQLLPFLISVSVVSLASNSLISSSAHHLPCLVVGPFLGLAGMVLILTVDEGSFVHETMFYEILAGVGIGMALHVPTLNNHSRAADASQVSMMTSMTLIAEHLGAAIFVMASQTAFMNKLVQTLPKDAPSLDVQSVIRAGPTRLRDKYTDPVIANKVVSGYNEGAKAAFVVSTVSAGMAVVIGLGIVVVTGLKRTGCCEWLHCSEDVEEVMQERGSDR